jgi:hypothetical protein
MIAVYMIGVVMAVLLLGFLLLPAHAPDLAGNASSPPAMAGLHRR